MALVSKSNEVADLIQYKSSVGLYCMESLVVSKKTIKTIINI